MGLPGFLMAALPFVLVFGMARSIPGFWQFPAIAAVGVAFGVILLRADWSRNAKTLVSVSVVVLSAVAFMLSRTAVGPFVLPVVVLGLLASIWRARAIERDDEERDAWRRSR